MGGPPGGAGSEAWNPVYMIAQVSKSFLNHNFVPRGSIVFGIDNFSLSVGNKTHLNEDSN